MQAIFRRMRPMLESNDLKGTIQFYSEVLGFQVNEIWEERDELKWITIGKDEAGLMFTVRNAGNNAPNPAMTGELYFNLDEIDQYFESIKDKCEVVHPIENVSYGMREFAIRDNNGYMLKFGCSLESKSQYDKFFPSTLVLESSRIQLRLLRREDKEELRKIAAPASIWKYFTKELSNDEELGRWIEEALEERGKEKRMPFVIIDKETQAVCGCSSLGNISFVDKRVEIGWTWLGTDFIGTGINHHAKFMLLSYAFDVLKAERVEIKTDNLNERAKQALRKIGAKQEGVLRNHMQMHSDRRRDTVYFSILKSEWEEVKFFYFSDLS